MFEALDRQDPMILGGNGELGKQSKISKDYRLQMGWKMLSVESEESQWRERCNAQCAV